MGTRKSYTAEFKQEAVALITQGGRSMAQVARDLDLNHNMLSRWKTELEAKGEQAFRGKGHAESDEVERLRRELETVRQERDILKKAVGIFSQLPR
jgi:transposase